MLKMELGSSYSVRDAVNAVQGARLDWVQCDKVYAQLGVALRALEKARQMAERAIEAHKEEDCD